MCLVLRSPSHLPTYLPTYHSEPLRATKSHSEPLKPFRVTKSQSHSEPLRATQSHSEPLRAIQSLRATQRHSEPLRAKQSSKSRFGKGGGRATNSHTGKQLKATT